MSEIVDETTSIAMMVGPIKHWWDENWDTPEHWHYADWRDRLTDALVDDGYLTYRPDRAFKGRWDERAQSVNDLVLRTSDVILNMTPPGVPSLGTDGEILYAQNYAHALVVPAPPTANFDQGITEILQKMRRLDIHHKIVEQEVVIDSVPIRPGYEYKVQAANRHFAGHVMRAHYFNKEGQVKATDAAKVIVHSRRKNAIVLPIRAEKLAVPKPDLLKVEVLERLAA